jgi:hypothetical protein
MKNLIFGNKYTVSQRYIRINGYHNLKCEYGWQCVGFIPKQGIYLGKRVISEGFTSEGIFLFKHSFTVYLFACDKRGLIYVPINNPKEL